MKEEKKRKHIFLETVGVISLACVLWGCTQTYSAVRVKESIQEICRKEYGIERIDVKIAGGTIGVYLPIKKLFVADFKEILSRKGGKLADMENLFQPAPEALDQVEDVLFSISRVLLSTDLKLQFYTLQATDVEKTGLQLVLSGYVEDIKRVRLWDISRDEYRKRIMHELRLNRAVIWHRPIRSFFHALERAPSLKTAQEYFAEPLASQAFQSLFFFNPEVPGNKSARWHLGELRSAPLETNLAMVYVPVTLDYDPQTVASGVFRVPSDTSFEHIFILSFAGEAPEIVRVIPLSYLDETGKIQKIPIPGDLDLEKDLESWETEFPVSEIHLGDFLAEQLTRRTQNRLFTDERIQNTFENVQLTFHYQRKPRAKNYFSLDLDVKLKTPTPFAPVPTILQEDVLYLLNLASREFVDVLRSYKFSDYEFLRLNLVSDPVSRVLGREDLELFRRNKINLQGLLAGLSPF